MSKMYVLIFSCSILIFTLSEIKGSSIPSDFIIQSALTNKKRHDKNSFLCRNGDNISVFKICDGVKDCPDGSDEVLDVCMKIECPRNTFRCGYGGCVDGDKKCNGVQDCADNSDELLEDCPGFTWLNKGVKSSCKRSEFQCRNGDCISKDSVCDGRKDCSDGTDETVTHCNAPYFTCPKRSFRCGYGACIDLSGKCNGVNDCADGSDEDKYVCDRTYMTPQEMSTTSRPIKPAPPILSTPSPINHDCNLPKLSPGTNYEHAAENVLQVKCDHDYVLRFEDIPFISCESGQWIPSRQTCLPLCKSLKSISAIYSCSYHGQNVTCQSPVRPGTISRADCALGYDSDKALPTSNECLENGQWKNQDYVCYDNATSKKPTVINNFYFIFYNSSNFTISVPDHMKLIRDKIRR